jgi:hypothetical protein
MQITLQFPNDVDKLGAHTHPLRLDDFAASRVFLATLKILRESGFGVQIRLPNGEAVPLNFSDSKLTLEFPNL